MTSHVTHVSVELRNATHVTTSTMHRSSFLIIACSLALFGVGCNRTAQQASTTPDAPVTAEQPEDLRGIQVSSTRLQGFTPLTLERYATSTSSSLGGCDFAVERITSDNTAIEQAIQNETLRAWSQWVEPTSTTRSPVELLVRAMNECQTQLQDTSAIDDSFRYTLSRDTHIAIERNDERVLSAGIETYDYSGGAHPNSTLNTLNINPSTQQVLQLQDLFTEPGLAFVARMRAQRLLEEYQDSLYGEVTAHQYAIATNALEANRAGLEIASSTQFLLTTQGLRFEFNPYDIAPYAVGRPQVLITSRELEPYLREAYRNLFATTQ